MTKADKAEQQKAIAQLREWLKPGDTVYTILRNVSRSGMSREIGVAIMRDGSMLHPNYSVSKALDYRTGKRDGIIMGGCGMDMGFALVYNLGRTLWPEGFGVESTKEARKGHTVRPLSPEAAKKFQEDPHGYKFRGRNGDTSGWDTDGGYALKHEWL